MLDGGLASEFRRSSTARVCRTTSKISRSSAAAPDHSSTSDYSQHRHSRSRPGGSAVLVLLENTRTLYPEPRVIQLPATTHFFGSKKECVTVICDEEAPTADQDGPR